MAAMPEVSLRRMTALDVDRVHLIACETFSSPWPRSSFMYEVTENPVARYLVAEEEGQVIGFAGVHLVLDEGQITNIAVRAPHRGRGIGRRLVSALMQYAANLGARYLTLEVRQSNQTAIGLYESLGFICVFTRQRYYENGEDALLMACDRLPSAQEDFSEPETVTSWE
ncbi:MAG: ribosomal protein S18-alanine N-acetyltransferase [Christensenellales bacterium]|jgi:ribosomal-protein-alanine N-acetyltransferase